MSAPRPPAAAPPAADPAARGGFRDSPLDAGLASVYERTLDCVHCGLCLSSCPTYRATGRETSSPRGRIHLMRGAVEGRVPLEAAVTESWLCLGCRACETACPSGVQYGALLEEMRGALESGGHRRGLAAFLERVALRAVVPRPRRLAFVVSLLGVVQRLRLDQLALPLLPAKLRAAHAFLPRIPARSARAPLPRVVAAEGERRGRVAVFEGCIMPELFGDVNRATVRVLAREGFEVVVPPAQGCCGALQAHAGDTDTAHDLARANLGAFADADVDAVVVNSAGCGAALRDYGRWLGEGGAALAGRARDVCEFLDEVGLRGPLGPVAQRVCYDDPCHLLHGQGVGAAPRRLLAAIPELELVPHDDPGSCCGAAGIYNVTHSEMSRTILDRKLDALAAADPDVVATGNPGCLMQLRAGAAIRPLRATILHPIQLLEASLEGHA